MSCLAMSPRPCAAWQDQHAGESALSDCAPAAVLARRVRSERCADAFLPDDQGLPNEEASSTTIK
jgi:hypothetical protein